MIKVPGGKVHFLSQIERQLPQPAVKIQEQARARMAKAFHLLEDALHIPQVVNQIGKDNDVEGFKKGCEIVYIRVDELQSWVTCLRPADHFLREIHPNAAPGLKLCQQAAIRTAKFQHAQIRANMKPENFREPLVVPPAHALPAIALAGHSIPVGNTGLLVGLTSWVGKNIFQHIHDCTWRWTDWKDFHVGAYAILDL